MKRRALFIALVFLISLIPLPHASAATPVRYFSFENFGVVNANVGASKTVTSANTWYLVGSTVISHDPKLGRIIITGSWSATDIAFDAYVYAVITTNAGETYTTPMKHVGPGKYSGDYSSTGTFTITVTKPFSGNSIQIDLYFEIYDYVVTESYWSVDVSFDSVRAYFLADDHWGIISSLTSYTPVDGVLGQALKLDNVEVLMNQVNVSTGTVAFDVKWDGTNTVNILKHGTAPVLWIDSTGHVNLKNDAGTIFTSNATLQAGTWQKVVVAFQSGTLSGGYIAVNDNETTIDWTGNFIADRVGDSGQTTSTLIDELNIYNEYMDLTAAAYGLTTYILKRPDGSTMTIYPEGGEQLGNITATFLDSAGNVLGTAILQEGSPEADIPANTSKVSLSSGNVERVYLLENITSSTLAFPALGDLVVKAIKLYVYPPSWDTLEIKTLDGKVVYRDSISTEASVTLIYGKYYTFTVTGVSNNETVTYSLVAQATDNLKLRFPDPDEAFTISTDVDKLIVTKDNDDLLVQVLLTQQDRGNITIEAFDANNNRIYRIDASFGGAGYTVRQDISDLEEAVGREISYFKVTVKTESGFTATKVLANRINYSYLISDKFFPHGLRLIFFTILGVFLVGRKHSDLSPLTAFFVLSLLALVGWIVPPAWFMAEVSVLAGISLYMSTADTSMGRNIEALSRIRIWRIPLSFWIIAVTLSYAPVIAHMMWPFFDFSDVYYSVKFMDDTVMQWFQGLAESSDWFTSTVGQVLYIGATGIKAIFMLLEGIVTGFLPAWKVMGLDTQIGDSPVTMANIAQSLVYMSYAWTLYMARKGGVEA